MALTRLDNLISSKTGKYLYVSPDDFNASDELNNRGNSPVRPFKSLQRAFIEISRFSYVPGLDNDRFDQFTVMVMPGKHYIDNRPGLTSSTGIDTFNFDQALSEWNDDSILDLSDPNNILYKFNNTEGGVIIPRGSSIIGYDLRRTSVHPLYVPDPADRLEGRSAIFNVTGGCYFWQFTIRDGDLEPTSPLYDTTDGVGKVYYQTPPADSPGNAWTDLAVPNFSHHKLTVFEYADKEELGLYYQKVAKAFAQYQPTIDDANEFSDRIEETRIVGPLSDIRAIESIKCTDSSPAGTITVEVSTKTNHGYFKNQFVAIESNGLDDQIDGTFAISSLDLVDKRKFSYQIPGTVSALGTSTNLVSGTTYTTANGLNSNAVVKAEVDSVESASPYVFNCSIRSTWGICGIWANGLKATGFKSVVIAQYTGVSLQKDDRAFIRYDEFTNTFNQASLTDAFATVPYHTKGDAFWKDDWRNFHVRASEDAFIQCVSIFAVGFADHFLMESGGDMSITNSNSNFGNTSLHAIGHKGYSFAQDKGGYITDIVPPKTVDESSGNTKRQSYYTLDVYASNDISNDTKIYHGDDQAIDPTKRPAATIGGYRIGAKTDDKLYVKLQPKTAGGNNIFFATLEPSGFKKFTATADILNPSGVTIDNKTLDAADRIEANKDFIAHEAYDRILAKYPALKVKETITITKCRRDVGYLIDATVQDLRLGGNVNTIQAAESYYVGNNLSYINDELTETLEGYNYAKDLALAAMRNFTYLRTGVNTTNNSAIINIGDTSGVVEGMTVADYDPSQFTNGKLNSGATRPTNPVIPNNTFVKRVIDSTSIELGDNTQTAVKQFVTGRYGDARALILANKTFIATEAYERMLLDFPNYTPSSGYNATTGKAKCIDDLEKAIAAIADNTGYGGNAETWDAADYYERGAVQDLAAKKTETLAAFNYCKDMAIQVMRKEDVFVFGTHGLTQSKVTANDPIATDQPELVSDRNGDARNLILANKDLIAAESVERMILGSSVQKFTPSAATYNAETGEMVLTSVAHGMTKASEHTVTNAVYTPADGKLVLTVAGHGFTKGQRVLIKDNSLSLQCTMDAGQTKTYPRATDPVSGKWLTITSVSTDTFEVNVGASPAVSHTPTAATYDPATGVMVLTIGNHTLKKGTSVIIAANSLTFTCAKDSNATNHTYPRSTDPFYNKAINIDAVTGTTITLFVGKANDNTAGAHTFVSAAANAVTSGGNYTHSFVSAVAGGVLSEQDAVRIDFNALNFTCGMDGNATQHSYPRISDPAGAKILPLIASTADTFTINVGKSPLTHNEVSNATYDASTGDLVLTLDNHNFVKGQTIRLADEALKFKCSQDSYATTHAYPRGDTTNLTPTAVAYDPTTGILTFTLNNHGLENKDRIQVVDNSLTFTCAQDSNGTQHTYPRATDPISGKYIPVSNVTTNTFDIQVLDNAPSSNTSAHICVAIATNAVRRYKDRAWRNALEITEVGSSFLTPTGAAYTPATGDLVLTKTAHGLSNGDRIKIARDSLTFTCAMDNNATEHKYPRASDPSDDQWLVVSDATANTFKVSVGIAGANQSFTPTGATYDPASGDLVLTIGSHNLAKGDGVLIENGAVSFKCTMDGNDTAQAYPRNDKDKASGRSLSIKAVTATSITVNVGNAGTNKYFKPSGASYNAATGVMVATIGQHGLKVGDDIVLKDNSLTFTCSKDNNATQHSYPRPGTDPKAGKSISITAVSSTDHTATGATYDPISGDLTITSNAHGFNGPAVFTPTDAAYNPTTGIVTLTIANHGLQNNEFVRIADGALKFTCAKDGHVTKHDYPRATDPASQRALTITNVTTNTFDVKILDITPSTNTTVHTFVSAVANSVSHGGDYVQIVDDSLTFTCSLDGNTAQKQYPRQGFDYPSGRWLQIRSKTTNTFTVNVGKSSDTSTHTFVSAVANGIKRQTGDITFNVGFDADANNQYTHTFVSAVNESIQYLPQSAHTFDSAVANSVKHEPAGAHTFKRAAANAIQKQSGTVTVNVGASAPGQQYDHQFVAATDLSPTNAAYNPTTGVMTITANGHGLESGDFVKIADNAFRFTCGQDSNATNHDYPRPSDPVSGEWLEVTGIDANNFSVQVLSSAPSTNTTAHTFVSAVANSVKRAVVKGGGNYTHTFKSAKADSVHKVFSVAGNRTYHNSDCIDDVVDLLEAIADNVAYGGNDKTWDAAYSYKTGNHVAGVKKTVTGASYDPATGEMSLTIGTHSHKVGERVRIPQGALTFTCAKDSNATNHSYPRATDPIASFDPEIKSVTGTAITVNVGPANDNTAGAHTFVSASKQIVVGGEETETNVVFEHAKDMAGQVIKNQKVLVTGSHGLTQTYDTTITAATETSTPEGKFGDAYNLLNSNAAFIAAEAYERMQLHHPTFLPPTGNKQDCIDDIKDFITEVAYNTGFGGNDRVWDMAQLYVTGAHVAGEETQTIEAFQDATQLAIQAMRNEKVLVVGKHGLTQTFDTTITGANETPINNKAADAAILLTLNKQFIADIAQGRMLANNSGYTPPVGYSIADCNDDLKDIVDVLAHNVKHGGNDRVWDTANLYVGGAVQGGAVTETVEAINHLKDVAIQVVQNVAVTVGGHTALSQVGYPATGTGTGVDTANPKCQNETSAITTLVTILTNAINTHSTLKDVTRTQSTYKCTTVESAISTLSTIVQNAITTPESLEGIYRTVSAATYNPVTGNMVLTVGPHSSKVGDKVHIKDGSLIFTCDQDSNSTEHAYPRSTDPVSKNDPLITAVDASTITINVLDTAPSTNTTAHIFVRATDRIQIGGVGRTLSSGGRCDNVRDTIDSLFKIVTDTISVPASLNAVTRNISNGPCQNVASAITTLFKLVTDTIQTQGNLSSIERTVSPVGLSTGNAVNATADTTNSYVYFTLPAGRYTSAYTPNVDDTITQDTGYPQCNTVSDTVRQYFANITTIIQTGVGTVTRNQPSSASSNLSARATIWGLKDWTPGPTSGSNPHQLETGTPVRLVPRPRYDTTQNKYVDVDKRNVRLPNGFDTNTLYYVIAPGRNTKPENYSGTTTFNGSDQTKLMLASSKDNAAAGIYIHSAEVEAIHPDVEIDIYQFVLDDKYDLHQYSCTISTAVSGGIITDIPHIFDVPNASVAAHEVFFRKNEGGNLPVVGGSSATDPDIADSNSRLRGDKFFYAKYNTAKVITIHKTHADAIAGTNPIIFVPLNTGTYNFSVFACKRESPMKYDPTYAGNVGTTDKGKWYLQVKNESSNSQSILGRFHDAEYNDSSGNNKTNDSYFERIDDSKRVANDRIYRLRYVIPKYLKSVRDPLNGFSIKTRKDETRKLLPQKLKLKPVTGNVTKAKFYNTSDSGNANEIIGYTDAEFTANSIVKTNASGEDIFYDPYKKDTKGTKNYLRTIETSNYVSMSVQSGRYYTEGSDEFLELTVFDHGITNTGLKNETFTTVKVTAPQGGSFTVNKTASASANAVTWAGNSSGSGYLHAALNVPGTATWHLILKGVSGDIKYSSTDNIRFTQGSVFADLLDYPDGGKSLVLKDLIKEGKPEFYYRQNGAKVYTITPGDIITDAANIQFYVESVEDVGEIDDTFYVYDVQEIQRRIFDQQDGIFYLTAIRGNISPYPTGAGNQKNFHNFKFSQPISKLYPLDYKNDPVWFKQIDPNANDPAATYSAADNYVHGLVSVNDFKGSTTKESVTDFLATEALKNNNYTGNNVLKAQEGNASAGSEDRKIPIAGDSTVVVDQRMYVELRRPSIARAGNHTFEYLGFGPGNYSTGFPARQEVLLSETQDFYSQSKKQDGGLVFYTGLNSNGDLYIGNRKIDAITGEEVFLESASLTSSDDEDDAVGNLVTTFDTPVTFNEYITVNGGENGDKTSTFNSPVTINVGSDVRDQTLGLPNIGVLSSLKVVSNVSATKDDATLDRTSMTKNRQTNGDILIAGNRVTAGVFQFNQRGSQGAGQGYKIQTHVAGGTTTASNVTPDQDATYNATQVVAYGSAGAPTTGDILLKGESVGSSGSLGWIFSNSFTSITGQIEKFIFNSTRTITVQWKSGVTNINVIAGGLIAGQELKLSGFSEDKLNGTWFINTGFTAGGNTCTFSIAAGDSISAGELVFNNTNTPNVVAKLANASWKEVGVLGSQTIRTDTQKIGEYKLGVNTVARAAHDDYADAFVSVATDPLANLDVVGTAWISGKTIENFAAHATLAARTLTTQDHAFMVGGDSASPQTAATFRVSTTNNGRVGVNTTLAEMQSAFTTKGTSEFTDTATFQNDIAVNGGGPGSANNADITTTITDGTATLFNDNTFFGLTSGTRPTQGLLIGGSVRNIELGNVTTASQNIKIGNTSTDSEITIGDSVDGSNANKSKITVGGAFASTESDSFVQIDTKALKIAGDTIIGTRRGLTDITKFESTSGIVEFLSGNSATSNVDFATNASTLTIAGQGGTTTIRNNLRVNATSRFDADVTLCGGYASYSFVGYRAQAGSGIQTHASGVLGGNQYNSNVDLITVAAAAPSTATGEYNEIDTAGTGDWGGTAFQATPAGQSAATFPVLTGNKYYLPIKKTPYDANGAQYYNENDILLIDTVEQSGRHAEFVKVTRLPQINSTPYYIEVERQTFGTLSTIRTDHPDETAIFKCTVQYNATWITAAIDGSGTEDNVYLAQFGGSLVGRSNRTTAGDPAYVSTTAPGDYVIITRTTTGDDGEIFELKETLTQVAKKLSVKNGCDTSNPITVFEVNSVTGEVTINGDQYYTGGLTLNGTCTTPYVNATTNKKLTITNGSGIKTFEVDTCTGDTQIGNQHGTVFMVAEAFGSSPAAYTKDSDVVYTYKHDPQSVQTDGPKTTIASNVGISDSSMKVASNYTKFVTGDMIAIYSGTAAIEIATITSASTLSGTDQVLNFATNTSYPNGGRGSSSNKIEGTVAQAWNIGADVVKINKYAVTTTLLHDVPATRTARAAAIKARTPNTFDQRLEIGLKNADLIQPKLDYVQYVRIGEEWFIPDSVHGGGSWSATAGLDAEYQVKMPKSIRNPNTSGTAIVDLFGGGTIKNHGDFEMTSGNLRVFGCDGITPVFMVGNDDGHLGDGSIKDPVQGTSGMQLYGPGTIHGNLEVKSKDCQSFGDCIGDTTFKVNNLTGDTEIGQKFYQKGKISATEIASESVFHIDNLGASGSTKPKDFRIYQNNAIDSFGIEKYWTGNGGRRHTYVAYDPTTGIGQQVANPLECNNNYLINASAGANMVIYLPDDAQTGDMIRITELSGNLTYNTSLIIRALKISNVATAIQGDTSGTKIGAGSNVTNTTAWDSGELVIQTRNAAFGLLFVGAVDIEGSANAQTIPASLRGWWLMEL